MVMISLRIDEDLLAQVDNAAADRGQGRSEFVRESLRSFLARNEPDPPDLENQARKAREMLNRMVP